MIDPPLAAFLEDGVSVHLGTRNAQFEPNGARAISVKVDADAAYLLVYISSVAAARVLPDLEANGQVAVVCARPVDDRAVQIKGSVVSIRPIEDRERAGTLTHWNAFLDKLEYIGIPRTASDTWVRVADLVIRVRVTALFEQTPGPQAGKALA